MPTTKIEERKIGIPTTKVEEKKMVIPAIKVEEKRMGMPEIRMKAQALGITPGKMKKSDLIHAIQVAEGYQPCFGRSGGKCPHTDCCFIIDCLKTTL